MAMTYYVRHGGKITGPFTVGELNSKIEAGVLSSGSFVTSNLGESVERLSKLPENDWWPLASVQDIHGLPPHPERKSEEDPSRRAIGLVIIVVAVALLVAILLGIVANVARGLH